MWLSDPPDQVPADSERETPASRVVLVLAILFFVMCLVHAAHSVMCCDTFLQVLTP